MRDVFVNGAPVVRDGQLPPSTSRTCWSKPWPLAARVNRFFIEREKSVLDKLVAIGGLEQQETFEVQAKGGRCTTSAAFERSLQHPEQSASPATPRATSTTPTFSLRDASQGRLRYREDACASSPKGSPAPIYTLTLTGPAVEAEYENSVVLSRARYTATADRSLRFYREYFQPERVREIVKHRERYHIRYQGRRLCGEPGPDRRSRRARSCTSRSRAAPGPSRTPSARRG